MKDNIPTPAVEDYLMVMRIMERDGKPIVGARLAEWMDVSPPTVSVTLKRMVRDGWIRMDEQQGIVLTERGQDAAAAVIRRHMLTEHLLARVLGVPWSLIHKEAGRLEHTLSEQTTQRMAAVLDDPATCPHGNPMPGQEALLHDLSTIASAGAGTRWQIMRIDEEAEENPQLLAYLERHRLLPGALVTVVETMPFNETITLQSENATVVLGLATARHVYVRPAP